MLDIKKGYGGNSSSVFTDSVDYDNDPTTNADVAILEPGVWVDDSIAPGVFDIPAAGANQTTVQIWEGHEHGITSGKLTVMRGAYRGFTDKFALSGALPSGTDLQVDAAGLLTDAAGGNTVAVLATAYDGTASEIEFIACPVGVRR